MPYHVYIANCKLQIIIPGNPIFVVTIRIKLIEPIITQCVVHNENARWCVTADISIYIVLINSISFSSVFVKAFLLLSWCTYPIHFSFILLFYFLFTVETYSGETLHLMKLDRRQMGSYLCIATNDVPPAVSKRITLHVNCKLTAYSRISTFLPQ